MVRNEKMSKPVGILRKPKQTLLQNITWLCRSLRHCLLIPIIPSPATLCANWDGCLPPQAGHHAVGSILSPGSRDLSPRVKGGTRVRSSKADTQCEEQPGTNRSAGKLREIFEFNFV